MQHNKFTGRVTITLVVLFVAIFGVPFIGGGIFPLAKLFDREIPLREKHALKPGIDLAGGISLIYRIKTPPNGVTVEDLATRVADALKRRVDPNGVRNLVWRPTGSTTLEIQMPLGGNSEEGKRAKDAYTAAQEQLENTNVRAAQARAVLSVADPVAREKAIGQLSMGSVKRRAVLEQMASLLARRDAAEKAGNIEEKVQAQVALEKIEEPDGALDQTNQSVARLQTGILEIFQAAIEKAQTEGSERKLKAARDARAAAVAKIKAGFSDFPARLAAIDNLVATFDVFAKVKGSVDDAEELKRLLKGSGVLEFHILWEQGMPALLSTGDDDSQARDMVDRLTKEGPTPRPNDVMRWYAVDRPEDFKRRTFSYGDKQWVLAYMTESESMVHKENEPSWGLESASPDTDPQSGQTRVAFKLDSRGGQLFGDLSGSHLQRPLAIMLDDKIISAPTLQSRIDGSGVITGDYSRSELDYLVRTLSAGSLPARLEDEPISERIVLPTLGEDNLHAGMSSCLIGLVVVALFLIGYYYLAGAVALVAVLLNLVIILGVLATFGATFTLPGLAGLVLTLGSAVDANVLIFERLREEEVHGISLRLALRNAYKGARSAILDSNAITIITSMILYWFGSEDVKGFGLTLLIGIASSLFTSLFVTRIIYDVMLEKFEVKKFGSLPLSIPAWDRMLRPNIDWIAKVKYFVALSLVIIAFGMAAFVTEGRKMYDIEFVSGSSVELVLKEPMKIEAVRKLIEAPEYMNILPAPQVVALGGGDDRKYEIVTANDQVKDVRAAIVKAFAGRLDIELPSDFLAFDKELDAARDAGAVLSVGSESRDRLGRAGFDTGSIDAHTGGVAIWLQDLKPPLTEAQLRQRLERARLQPEFASMPYRKAEVLVAGDRKLPASAALILMSDEAISADKDMDKWAGELAKPAWKLVVAAVHKPADLGKVSNFNPQVAQQTLWDAVNALTISLILVMLYVWMRFGNLKYGGATVLAMVHDVVLVVGCIGMSHYIVKWLGPQNFLLVEPFRINLTLVAAILTVMGYSMVDTIVVFDRIRENRGIYGYLSRKIINDSINQTLSRTLLTAGTTIVMIFIMYIIGGAGLHGFTFALLVGILVGTYSSIAIAAPILLLGGKEVRSDGGASGTSLPARKPVEKAAQG